MFSWLIGLLTGLIYDAIGIVARFKSDDAGRKLKARWALSLGVWNSGGWDDYYLEELDRFLNEDQRLLNALEKSLPAQSASFLVQRKRLWLTGFRASVAGRQR